MALSRSNDVLASTQEMMTSDVSGVMEEVYGSESPTIQSSDPNLMNEPIELAVAVVGLVAVIVNLFAIVVIKRYTTLTKHIYGLLIFHQTIIDCCVGLTTALNFSYLYVKGRQLPQGGSDLENHLYCHVVAMEWLPYTCMYLSTYNLVVIAWDRYLSIVKPMFHLKLTKQNFAWPCIVFIWVFFVLYTLRMIFAISDVDKGECLALLDMLNGDKGILGILGTVDGIVFYAFPLASLIYLYTHILVTLARKKSLSKSGVDHFPKAKRNLLRTMFIVTAAFVLCTTPDQVVLSLYEYGNSGVSHNGLLLKAETAGRIMLWMGTCVNPAIYLASHNDFQSGVRKLFRMKP